MNGTNTNFTEIAGRDASAVIRGFVFQVNLTILRWIELPADRRLALECGEDIDTVENASDDGLTAEKRLLEQIKVRDTRSLTLRTPEALQSVANFCRHRQNNPGIELAMRYVTTAVIAVEQDWPRTEGAIDTWMSVRRGVFNDSNRADAIAAIRAFLVSCTKPDKTSDEAWQALQATLTLDEDSFLSQLIMPFEWGAGYGNYLQIEQEAIAALSTSSFAQDGTPESVFEHLFAYVFRVLCRPGGKELTAHVLKTELESPTISQSDRGILRLLRDEFSAIKEDISEIKIAVQSQMHAFGELTKKVETLSQPFGVGAHFALIAPAFLSDPPEVLSGGAPRNNAVQGIVDLLDNKQPALILGEPGSGKTQLSLFASDRLQRRTFWLNIPREASEAQADGMLEGFLRSLLPGTERLPFRQMCELACKQLDAALVIVDDLPRIIPRGQLSTRIETFANSLRAVGGLLLMSSYFPLPETLTASISLGRYEVKRFDAQDVLELLAANAAPTAIRTEQVANLLVTLTEGLPMLAMAAVRYLRSNTWNFTYIELEALFKGEFATAHRRDAVSVLEFIVRDQEERELLARMSLAIGDFSSEDIARVARVPQGIPLVGEKIARATGVWLQKNSDGRFTRSPLITAASADALDPKTKRGVHFALAMLILDRKELAPIEVFTCFNHLLMAKTTVTAVVILLQALSSLLEMEDTIEDDFGFARMWTGLTVDNEIPLDLLLYLKSMQIAVLAKQGRDLSAGLSQLDTMLAAAPSGSWGAAMAAATIAIYVVWLFPSIANKYLVEALRRMPAARLPDGSSFPTPEYPLEMILWMSSYTGKSDEDADSWIATVAKLSREQIVVLESSEMMEDNVTILCDGIWRREFDKPEAARNWQAASDRLKRVEAAGDDIGFPLLSAAAIRTQIVILAEWEHRLEDAVSLAESALKRLDRADCQFLIREVSGRQISYAGQGERAIPWLERALKCDAFRHSLWRRDVLITLAELKGPTSRHAAVELTAQAIVVAEGPHPYDLGVAEAFAEHGIALWKAEDRRSAFAAFENAVDRFLKAPSQVELWKGSFFRLFAALVYFSDVMQHGKPREGHQEPEQASFLGSRDAHPSYKDEQQSYICLRLAMYADGLGDLAGASKWVYRAIERASEFPEAWTGLRLQCILALPQALLTNDFDKAAELARLASEQNADKLIALGRSLPAEAQREFVAKAADIESVMTGVPTAARHQAFLMHPFIPLAMKLVTLSLEGASPGQVATYLSQIETHVPVTCAPAGFVNDLRRALIARDDWHTLQQEGYVAIPANNLIHGYVLVLGAMYNAPVEAALGLQITLAEHLEGFFGAAPSLYRHLIAPMFRVYWDRATGQSMALFRTPQAYTRRQLQLSDGSPRGTRQLLAAMASCLGVGLPPKMAEWLSK
ncbi:ATP-binding protein [Terriglobus sp. RCC_193]|uniref:ATP-binding protein n=1 Tax=Terriglobus sp. RCC_193 TaxID=3239218 RepID=UPI0035233559